MLSRAARRRDALRYFDHTSAQLQLPWLCPALSRTYSQQPLSSKRLLPHSSAKPSQRCLNRPPIRRLASAATAEPLFDADDDYIPFNSTSRHSLSASPPPSQTRADYFSTQSSHLPSFDLSSLLIFDDTITTTPDRIRNPGRNGVELRGTSNEIETTLFACLHVHKWDRAAVLLRQLRRIYSPGSSRLLFIYNRCLDAMVFDMVMNRHKNNIDMINRWVEVDMKEAGIEPDAVTYALNIKVALATMQGSKRDRTVRRYWELAKSHEFDAEVAGLRDILTDSDLGKLTEICPMTLPFDLDARYADEQPSIEVYPMESIVTPAIPGILETTQKGYGLEALRKSLSLFSPHTHLEERDKLEGTPKEVEQQYNVLRQARLETDAVKSAIERWRLESEKTRKLGITSCLGHGKLGALLWQWHQLLSVKLREEISLVEEAETIKVKSEKEKRRCEYGPFLRLLSPEQLAASTTIVVMQIMSKLGMRQPAKLASIVVDLGKAVEAEVAAMQIKAAQARTSRPKVSKDTNTLTSQPEGVTQPASRPYGFGHRSTHANSSIFPKWYQWSVGIHGKVGAILCELLFDSAKITVSKDDPVTGKMLQITQPVFNQQIMYQQGRKVGTIALHPEVVDMVAKQPAADLIARQLPMVSEPRPWQGIYDGGYLESVQSFLRVKNREAAQRQYAEAAAARGDLDTIFAGVNVLGKTAWRINRDVFSVMLEAWNSGQAIADLPPLDKVFPEIPKPDSNSDKMARYRWFQVARAIQNEKSGLHSSRCFQNFQMEIARAFLNETFYLPHNIDFRGRAYPIPPYLNQMGADNCRGLLLFDNGKPLGARGLRWLKIHLANVFGYDKASLSDREAFPMEHWEDLLDSVQNPLSGRRWWLKAEDPWQALAACFELKNALDLDDPSTFVSRLPIHQDGSCNGLQHYAALGGDIAGAKQVNLEPGDKPADVYSGVAELVKAEVSADAAKGDSLAQLLDGRMTRKIVKQTVMTNVYGVTFLGAMRQVRKQLDDIMPDLGQGPTPQSGKAAAYIARKIFKILGAMFSGARDIQFWLGDCAIRITSSVSPSQLCQLADRRTRDGQSSPRLFVNNCSQAKDDHEDSETFRSSVIWTTPLKLPVVQPYRVSKGQRIKTQLQDIMLVEPTAADSVNKRKQLQAFPPNFIHSLDATHMILSALDCDKAGLTFSAVHDSFWTHAADVDVLNSLLRDAFIRMHSEDIIGRLGAEFKKRYEGHMYLAQVQKRSPLGKELSQYRKKNKLYEKGSNLLMKQRQELLREIKKRDLMNSSDPANQEEGRNMVTASSIFDMCDGEQYLHAKSSLGETAIGAIPNGAANVTIEHALAADEVGEDVGMSKPLDPLVDDETAEDEVVFQDPAEVEPAKKKEKKKVTPTTWLWLPLTFRDIPKKGNFDVTRLRNSQYFFS